MIQPDAAPQGLLRPGAAPTRMTPPGVVPKGVIQPGAAPKGAAATLPLAIALAIAPVASVLQSRALAPIAVAALVFCVVAHRRRTGDWPWPHGAATWAALALFGWGAVTALWAVAPMRAFGTAVQIGGFVALGAATCRAVAAADEAAKRRLMQAACGGLVAGIVVAGLDAVSGNAIRATVRGLREVPSTLVFGLKPAASAMALLLPLIAAAPGLSRLWRVGLMLAGAAVLLLLPGEAAKLAVLAAGLAGGAALLAPRWVPRLLGAGLAVVIVGMPAILGPVLTHGVPAGGLAPSAAHRLLIWDFVVARVADKPIGGWGMDSSRAIPGHLGHPAPAALDRFGLTGPNADFLATTELLPLHPHNGALQLWLELGLPGAVLGAALALLLGLAAARAERPAVATAVLAAAAVTTMLSFGVWQEWWVGAELLAAAGVAALPRRGTPGGLPP